MSATVPEVTPTSETAYDTGVEIRYYMADKEAGVKRHYEVRKPSEKCSGKPHDAPHCPCREWKTVPSVSTITDTLGKELGWWGMTTGADGVRQLYNMGILFPVTINSQVALGCRDKNGLIVLAGTEQIVELLGKHGMTVNQMFKDAGERGTNVHDALEFWCAGGVLPDPAAFPPAEQPYVIGLVKFLKDAEPEPLNFEVSVASLRHGFAGRFDLRLHFPKTVEVVEHHTPKRGAQITTIEAGTTDLDDLKTSKGVYVSHAKQLAGYSIGCEECGFEKEDGRAVIHVDREGNYRYVRCEEWATHDDFLTTLAEYTSQQEMKSRKPKGGKS